MKTLGGRQRRHWRGGESVLRLHLLLGPERGNRASRRPRHWSPARWTTPGPLDRHGPAPPNSGTITGASKTATQVTFSLAARHYCRVGDEFTVGSILGMTDANGVWEVAAVPATNQITIDLVTAQTYTSAAPGRARCRGAPARNGSTAPAAARAISNWSPKGSRARPTTTPSSTPTCLATARVDWLGAA